MVRPGRRLDVGANRLSQVRTGHPAESEIKEGPEPSSQQNKSTGGSLLCVTHKLTAEVSGKLSSQLVGRPRLESRQFKASLG